MAHVINYGWTTENLSVLPTWPSQDGDYVLTSSSGSRSWTVASSGGAAQVRAIEVANGSSFNANPASASEVTAWTATGAVEVTSSGFSVSNGLVVVPVDGVYRVASSVYVTGTGARSNFLLQASVNGVAQRAKSASAYIRNASGHNESSNSISTLLALSANDTVSIITTRQSSSSSAMTCAVGDAVLSLELVG